MDYKDDFFTAYRKYLDDPILRREHDKVFKLFSRTRLGHYVFNPKIVDYGCGTAEFGRFLATFPNVPRYVGIDLDVSRVDCNHGEYIQGSYDTPVPDGTKVIVSLFGTELHMSPEERNALYDRWLSAGVKSILVSGFYYHDRPLDEQYAEDTGYTCYQATPVMPMRSDELRVTTVVPPGMFNKPYTEVWRLIGG